MHGCLFLIHMMLNIMISEWNRIYHDVWEDVDNDNCRRLTQNNLRKLAEIHRQTELENKLLKNELLRLFDRLCIYAKYPRRFDMEYLENWLNEQKKDE